ncbi:hypothetical protein EIP91_009341 [Steccherinum ochraceum]|uniref:FAD/NAD(P)-binding domain-containing protein n=1 Tax=Steccherinum ochraceum TaxID=92696 RepID=A0A4R0RKE3_9APHY|nr:hypothetical protein EIP91_009341 [Steccherinum ochraceum]
MSSEPYLPTRDRLPVPIPPDVDANAIGRQWLASFAQAVDKKDVSALSACIHPEGWWRDLFALTWDLRSFHGDAIHTFISERVFSKTEDLQFHVDPTQIEEAALKQPLPDLAWILVQFPFTTKVGQGKGIAYLVPSGPDTWQAFTIATHLIGLTDHPEITGSLRSFAPNHGKWEEQRRRERDFVDSAPEVLIVGAGHSGLDTAARLGSLGVKTLVVDKNERVGDNWRGRYEALCLHDVVWFNHLPYLNFPSTWPVYIPAKKIADWLEHYVDTMELNTGKWKATVQNVKTGEERSFEVDHVVFALGLAAGRPYFPTIPGQDQFKGQTLHSMEHKSAKDHLGKKVVIIGACTSAHDIASEYADFGVDVTIYQRSSTYIMTNKEGMPRLMKPNYWEGGPPIDDADRLANSFPVKFSRLFGGRAVKDIMDADKELLDGLHRVGYRTNEGEGGGLLWMAIRRGGGYYLDVGACQKIVDGKIKIKNDAKLTNFTPTGLQFDNGSHLDADVVLFATGFGDFRDVVRPIVGDTVVDRMPPIWGINDEGEIRGVWREIGTPGLWYMVGNFAWSRFFSRSLALQIKAKQVGEFGTRYSAPQTA